MSQYRYAVSLEGEGFARAVAKDVQVSTKAAIETCNFIRGKTTAKAKRLLEEVALFERAVPYKRFTNGAGHRKGGMGPGKYPQNAVKAILTLLNQVEKNAENKGLSAELTIAYLVPKQASRPMRGGRQRGRQAKRTHIEVVVKEQPGAQKEVAKKAPAKSQKEPAPAAEKKEATPAAKEVKTKAPESSAPQSSSKKEEKGQAK
ncbi:MAG: 50S ribosomal protein L22 [Candidatus Woesearchaeota archaeon]|nr:MAG: 50S ribosomal protein L22 [Candidatus Woesearchaeota archaeon]